jgi:uncharacterized protein (DUF2236 family)
VRNKQDVIGYFGPDTLTWRLYREPLFVLGGVRALLLQIAHPAVAEGVARYSNFKADPFGRGYRTFAAMAQIYFGDKAQADRVAQRLWRIHEGIRGAYPHSNTGAKPFGANDPELLLWVLATLTDTTLQVYERITPKGLPNDWRERFYEESKIAARVLGIPDAVYPPDLQSFNRYFENILHGDLLGAAPVCREQAQAIVHHPRSIPSIAAVFAAGWLPPALIARLGIEAGPNPQARLGGYLRRFAFFYRLLPAFLRYNPAYQQGLYRIARAEGRSGPLMGRFFDRLARYVKVPLGLPLN